MVKSSLIFPSYPSDFKMAIRLALPLIFNRKRSFRRDALNWIKNLYPAPVILGRENIPQNGPFLLVFNHYFRLKYRAWWSVLAAAAIIPTEIHWVMAAAWTFPDHPFGRLLESFSRVIFRRIAQVYNLSLMPPMPPRPWEIEARAKAVRSILTYVQKNPKAALGLAPEGGDSPSGVLDIPAPGVGRFLLHLSHKGLMIYPLGIYESGGALTLNFGKPLSLEDPAENVPESRDRWGSQVVMQAIAELLPKHLQGVFNRTNPAIRSQWI